VQIITTIGKRVDGAAVHPVAADWKSLHSTRQAFRKSALV